MKVAKRYLTLANDLHESRDIFLSQLILESLYESLGLATESLKNSNPMATYWFLQLWMNAMFELSMDVEKPNDADETTKNRSVEGTLDLLK